MTTTTETHHARGFHRLVKLIERRGLPVERKDGAMISTVTVRINEYNSVRIDAHWAGGKTRCFDANGMITAAEAERLIGLAEMPEPTAEPATGEPELSPVLAEHMQRLRDDPAKFYAEQAGNAMNCIENPTEEDRQEFWLRSLAGWSLLILAHRFTLAERVTDAERAKKLRSDLDSRVRTSELRQAGFPVIQHTRTANQIEIARRNLLRKYENVRVTGGKPGERPQYHARELAWWALRWLGHLLDARDAVYLSDAVAGIRDELRSSFDAGYLD